MTDDTPAPLPAGIHDLLPRQYHADPQRGDGGSVTSSICRNILAPDGCPRLVQHEQSHPTRKSEFDLGSALHRVVLGKGEDLHVLIDDDGQPFRDLRKKAAQDQQLKAYEAGEIPLLARQRDQVLAAAREVWAHPEAGRLLAPGSFRAEQTIIWPDEVLGVWRRCMVDALADDVAVDVKTTARIAPRALGKAVAEHGYDQQQAFYDDGLAWAGIDVPFVFVFVQIEPPHLVQVHTLPPGAVTAARALNRDAIELWSWCVETGAWPGFVEGITELELPRWRYREDS